MTEARFQKLIFITFYSEKVYRKSTLFNLIFASDIIEIFSSMKLSQFVFDLPLNLIAQHPAKNRDESRMMVVHRSTGQIENRHFKDVIDYFNDKDVLLSTIPKCFPPGCMGERREAVQKLRFYY